jgi:two-component system phosphate regulon sensor histidine kinase PhoR
MRRPGKERLMADDLKDGAAPLRLGALSALAAALAGAGAAALGSPATTTALCAALGAGLGGALAGRVFAPRRAAAPVSAAVSPAATSQDGRLQPGLGRALVDSLPSGLILIGDGDRVVYDNPAAQEILERRMIGVHYMTALRSPALTDAIARALETGAPSELDLTLPRAKERHLHVVVRALPGAEPGAPRAMLTLDDRTRAAKAEELRRDFIANASHELKTPLSSILGFIETLQGHAKDDPEAAQRFLAIMLRQAERMKRLVDDLLSLNRIEINEHVRPTEPVDLAVLAPEVCAALKPIADAAGARIAMTPAPTEAWIRGSRDELSQVFVNLIDNAIKYAGDAGPITVTFVTEDAPRDGMIGVRIADSGPGIAREHVPRLTERFYRVDVARSRERGGTGLGLAIAKHVLNRHRGELAVSSAPGQGARFTAWFPRAAAPSESASDPAARAAAQ